MSGLEWVMENSIPEPNTGCYLWLGTMDYKGYGRIKIDGRFRSAHRTAYEMVRGPIPDGLTIDHLCRMPSCINPDHMETVSMRENILRAYAAKWGTTHCRKGHPKIPENRVAKGGGFVCLICQREHGRRMWRKHHAVPRQSPRRPLPEIWGVVSVGDVYLELGEPHRTIRVVACDGPSISIENLTTGRTTTTQTWRFTRPDRWKKLATPLGEGPPQ